MSKKLYATHVRRFLDSYKDRPCAECRQSFPYFVMQFDHIDPTTKRFNISQARAGTIPMRVLTKELLKCEVVCANCHLLREWKRK